MKFSEYINEKKWLEGTMIGFKLDETKLKRIYDYIESWLIRYKIDYKKQDKPHFTIAQIPGEYSKDELIRSLNDLHLNIKFNPKGLTVFNGVNVPKDFIVLEYKANTEFVKAFKKVAAEYEVRKFPDIRPHTSIFIIEQKSLPKNLLKDMKYSLPKLPILKPKEITLWNNKFEIETSLK